MATMREVAALAGVSGKTVSRVVNGDRYVSDAVRIRVQNAIERLNYVPNMLAQTFRQGRDTAIGVAVPSLADPFFAAFVDAVTDLVRGRQTAVLIANLGERPDDERPAVESLLRRQVAGLLLVPVSDDHRYVKPWLERTPVVFVDRPPRRIVADSVVHDDIAAADRAVSHLMGAGHRRIAFFGNAAAIYTTERRMAGYRDALARHGVTPDPAIEIREVDKAPLVATLDRVLDGPDPVTAIFCANANYATRLVPLLHARGRSDIGFVSFGDFVMADSLTPSVTVVDQKPSLLGETAVRRLFARIDEPNRRLKRQLVLPVELHVRESSLATPARAVRSAG